MKKVLDFLKLIVVLVLLFFLFILMFPFLLIGAGLTLGNVLCCILVEMYEEKTGLAVVEEPANLKAYNPHSPYDPLKG